MTLADVSADVLLGLAALLASLCGVILTLVSVRSGRKDATQQAELVCHEKLLAVQREAEKLSSELHSYRMAQYGGYGISEAEQESMTA